VPPDSSFTPLAEPVPTPVAATRTEHDFLGEKQIPAAAYWGVHTARAVENFPISGTRISAMPDLIRALGFVKKAAARTNQQLGALDARRAAAIMAPAKN
jgi:aspartate ammonia-lyase